MQMFALLISNSSHFQTSDAASLGTWRHRVCRATSAPTARVSSVSMTTLRRRRTTWASRAANGCTPTCRTRSRTRGFGRTAPAPSVTDTCPALTPNHPTPTDWSRTHWIRICLREAKIFKHWMTKSRRTFAVDQVASVHESHTDRAQSWNRPA